MNRNHEKTHTIRAERFSASFLEEVVHMYNVDQIWRTALTRNCDENFRISKLHENIQVEICIFKISHWIVFPNENYFLLKFIIFIHLILSS